MFGVIVMLNFIVNIDNVNEFFVFFFNLYFGEVDDGMVNIFFVFWYYDKNVNLYVLV